METWHVEVVNEIAKAEIDALPADIRAKLLHLTEMMVAIGPQRMREPHVKPLRDKLWEIRMNGKDGIGRAIYILVTGRRIVILHAFIKKTQKTPPDAIKLAFARTKEIRT